MTTNTHNRYIIFFVLAMVFMSQSSIDLYLPSFPIMQAYFHVSSAYIQASLTVYLISYALSQLFYGPLSDQYGRKTILLFGALIFILGSILCAMANSIWILLLGRCIQGFGIGAPNVLSRIVLRDAYSGVQLLKNASLLTMTWALSPIIAPVIGAYLQALFGWQSNFLYLSLSGTIFFVAMLTLFPETLPVSERRKISFTNIRITYLSFIINKKFLSGCFGAAILFSSMIAISSLSPFIYHNAFRFNSVQFGWITFSFCSGFLLGSLSAPQIAKKLSLDSAALWGMITILCLFTLNIIIYENLYSFTIMLFMVMFLCGLISPQCVAISMSTVSSNFGFAGALFGFIVFTTGFMTTIAVSKIGSPTLMLLISALMIFFIFLYLWLRSSYKISEKHVSTAQTFSE